jgi:ribosomal protein L29
MVAFYNQADQDIYNLGSKFVPQERYRLGYTPPVIAPTAAPVSGGITNTNAFTNSGGNNFNPAGNAFGYGTPVSEVNVRTFNPKELPGADPLLLDNSASFKRSIDPSTNNAVGGVNMATAGMAIPGQQVQNMYNVAQNTINQKGANAMSGVFPNYTAKEVARLANNNIQDYRQNYGAEGQYISPYEDSMDLGYQGTLGNKGRLNRFRNKVGDVAKFAGALLPFPLNLATKFLPRGDDNGPGGGTYGIAGLSDAQKEQYNALAGIEGGGLFQGQGGMKTLTGKNFNAKGYMEGQMELAKGFNFDTMTDEEIAAEIAKTKANPKKQFKYKQMLEASQMYKTGKIQQEKQRAAAEANRASTAAIQGRVDRQYQDQMTRDGKDFSVSGPDTSANPTGKSNQASSERGYQMHGADGGRAGYFFGGRVNFKDGGLASIL